MKWEELILSALRDNEDLNLALEKAARIAPRRVSLVLRNFPSNTHTLTRRLNRYPKVISLLCFHFLAIKIAVGACFVSSNQNFLGSFLIIGSCISSIEKFTCSNKSL